jgi:hypothetical protein
MDKLIIAISALTTLMLSATVMAENNFKKDIQDISRQLNINEEKKLILKDVITKHHEERNKMVQQKKEERYQQHIAMRAMHERHRNEIKDFLSLSEFETFEKIMFFKHKHRSGGAGNKPVPFNNQQPM